MIRLLIVGAGCCPMVSFALGLGEIQIESRLNQPLRARIEVLDVSDEEWGRMQTHLNRQSAPDTLALQPHVLDAITVRAIQDSQHRHFVEIRSTESLAEPLFDLPVEVAGPTGRVIRNYSVLLDPPGVEDVRHATADSQATAAQVAQAEGSVPANGIALTNSAAPPTGSDPQAAGGHSTGKPTHSNTGHRASTSSDRTAQRHARQLPAPAGTGVSTPANAQMPDSRASTAGVVQAAAASQANSAVQQDLLKQLEALQQTLTKMQETIAAQNDQIADLTAKVARAESKAARAAAAPQVSQPSANVDADADASDTEATEDEVSPRPYFWLTVVLGAATAIALVSAIVFKWRAKRATRNSSAAQRAPAVEQRSSQQVAGVTAGYGRAEEYAPSAGYGSTERRRSSDHQASSPSTLQKQMEADGRVQIDWDKEVWNTPEWLRLFGEQPSLAGHGQQPSAQQPSPQQPSAHQFSAHQPSGPHQAGSEPPDARYSDARHSDARHSDPRHSDAQHSRPGPSEAEDADLASYIAALPEATSSLPVPPGTAAGAAPSAFTPTAAATTAPPAERDTAEMPKAYFADLPKVSTMEVPAGAQLADSDSPTILAPDLEELTQTMTERIFGEDTTKLAEAYAAAIRERVPDHDIARRIDADHEDMLNAEMTSPSDTETTRLSDTEAARLLTADLSNLTEADLSNLTETDLAKLARANAAALAKTGTAVSTDADTADADATQSTHADAANPTDSDTAKIVRADPKVIGEGTMPNSPRLRRRAGRRR